MVDDASFVDIQQNGDLDFQLIWPDSEKLFQSLMSADTSSHVPLGTLPLPSSFDDFGIGPLDNHSGAEAIPIGGGHQAVHGVSKMISNLVSQVRSKSHTVPNIIKSSSVTAEVEASSVTSVFLDECLHMFFERFIPTFPVLHRPTFVFKDCTHPLLLNAIAIGTL